MIGFVVIVVGGGGGGSRGGKAEVTGPKKMAIRSALESESGERRGSGRWTESKESGGK